MLVLLRRRAPLVEGRLPRRGLLFAHLAEIYDGCFQATRLVEGAFTTHIKIPFTSGHYRLIKVIGRLMFCLSSEGSYDVSESGKRLIDETGLIDPFRTLLCIHDALRSR